MLIAVGLGGNRGDVPRTFAWARRQLEQRFQVPAASSLWRTRAVGPEQPDFLNAVVLLRTESHPLSVLSVCQDLESRAGRDRASEARWGPRSLDLDLLLADSCVLVGPLLRLPHPRLALRRFALAPAAEIVPTWTHQHSQRTIADLAREPDVVKQACEMLGPFPAA